MLRSLSALFLFAAAVFAQNAFIGLPTSNQSVNLGQNLVVQVQQPDSLTGSEEVAIVIGVQSCASRPCVSPAEYLGDILYNGPFDPQFHEPQLPPYQNFTVQIPSSIGQGTALIELVHLSLIGAGSYPYLELQNQTVTMV